MGSTAQSRREAFVKTLEDTPSGYAPLFIDHNVVRHPVFKDSYKKACKDQRAFRQWMCAAAFLTHLLHRNANAFGNDFAADKHFITQPYFDRLTSGYSIGLKVSTLKKSHLISPFIRYNSDSSRGRAGTFSLTEEFGHIISSAADNGLCLDMFDVTDISIEHQVTEWTFRNEKFLKYWDIAKRYKFIPNREEVTSEVKYTGGYESCIKRTVEGASTSRIMHSHLYPRPTDVSHWTSLAYEDVECAIAFAESPRLKARLRALREIMGCCSGIEHSYARAPGGRLYSSGPVNLQLFPKATRHVLLCRNYVGIDISAAIATVMAQYAIAEGYPKYKLETVLEFVNDPAKFRAQVLTWLRQSDQTVTPEYVKRALTSVCYGASFSSGRVFFDIENGTSYSIPVKLSGYGNKATPLNLSEYPAVVSLSKEFGKLISFLCQKKRIIHDGKSYLLNAYGSELPLGRGVSKGKRLAHLYQAMEGKILQSIYEMEHEGKRLIDTDNAIGLLLHDGIYINRPIFEKIGLEAIEAHVFKETGYTIRFTLEDEMLKDLFRKEYAPNKLGFGIIDQRTFNTFMVGKEPETIPYIEVLDEVFQRITDQFFIDMTDPRTVKQMVTQDQIQNGFCLVLASALRSMNLHKEAFIFAMKFMDTYCMEIGYKSIPILLEWFPNLDGAVEALLNKMLGDKLLTPDMERYIMLSYAHMD